jgi:hypothetical protein
MITVSRCGVHRARDVPRSIAGASGAICLAPRLRRCSSLMACLVLAFCKEQTWMKARCEVIETCANPKCGKALHYLREGRVLAFVVAETGGGGVLRRVEHYWLCGRCCSVFTLKREGQIISLVTRPSVIASNADENGTA